jgi:hypothetical protein
MHSILAGTIDGIFVARSRIDLGWLSTKPWMAKRFLVLLFSRTIEITFMRAPEPAVC